MVVITATTVATVAAVAKVTPAVLSLISKIIHEAETSSQNKDECTYLAGRLSGIDKHLRRLQQQAPGLAEELARLSHTLNDAHELVVACQKWRVRRFTRADVLAARFDKVNRRIDSHLIDITAFCQVDMKGCPDGTTLLLPPATTASSRSLTVATTALYGQRIRKRDLIRGSARMLVGVIFHKPEYIAKGLAKISR